MLRFTYFINFFQIFEQNFLYYISRCVFNKYRISICHLMTDIFTFLIKWITTLRQHSFLNDEHDFEHQSKSENPIAYTTFAYIIQDLTRDLTGYRPDQYVMNIFITKEIRSLLFIVIVIRVWLVYIIHSSITIQIIWNSFILEWSQSIHNTSLSFYGTGDCPFVNICIFLSNNLITITDLQSKINFELELGLLYSTVAFKLKTSVYSHCIFFYCGPITKTKNYLGAKQWKRHQRNRSTL